MKVTVGRPVIGIGAALGLILFLAVPGSWGQEKKDSQESRTRGLEFQGTVRVSGAWALYPMMVKWGEEFRKTHPKVRVDISAGGAGKGIADALVGLVDIGMVSREITSEEIKRGAYPVSVVKDAVFPTMNRANPVLKAGFEEMGMKKQAFIDLWIKGSSMTWGQLAGASSKDKVRVYTRSDSCGAAETWAQYLGGKNQEDLRGIGVYGDPGLAEAVRKDISGMGYNNLGYAYDFKTGLPLDGLSIIPIDVNENGKIDSGEILRSKDQAIRAINSDSYPSPPARLLYLVTKEKYSGLTKVFVGWVLTEGQRYVEEIGYIKLTSSQVSEALKRVGK